MTQTYDLYRALVALNYSLISVTLITQMQSFFDCAKGIPLAEISEFP